MTTTNGHGAKPERVALYMRVSSEEQRDTGTIQTQREFLERLAAERGFEVIEVYADEGVSGKFHLHERPEGLRLLEEARAGKFDTVLVYKLDRLARSQLGILDATDRLERLGVGLRSATEQYETATAQGRLLFQMLGSFAEFERGVIRERTRDGFHRVLRDGRRPGKVPYGYDIHEDGEFVIVEDEARVVAQIIENIAGGSTCYAEARRLNAEGVPSPGWRFRGRPREHGQRWSGTTISALLHQPAYGEGHHEARLSSGEVVSRDVPVIVAPETQQRALAQLAENKRYSGGRNRRDYVLRGLVRCGTCGSACAGHSTTARDAKRHYYVCANDRASSSRPRRGPKGHAPFVNAEALEAMVWADVRQFLENPGEVLERVREQMESDDAAAELEGRHADLSKRLVAKSAEKDRYVRAYAQDLISEDELADYVTDLKNQIRNLKLLISSVEDELDAARESREIAEGVEAWLLTLRQRIHEVEGGTPEAYRKRRELVKLLVEQITTSRGEDGRTQIEVRYRFGPPEGPDRGPGSQAEHVCGDKNTWENMAATVAGVYDSLSSEDRSRACVFTANYGEAGAVDFFGERYGLPRAISGHNSYYVWGPGDCTGEVVISVGVPRRDLEAIFGEVEQEATIRCEYCMPDEDNLPVYVSRDPRAPLQELWPRVKRYN